jgi:hypothetical protein
VVFSIRRSKDRQYNDKKYEKYEKDKQRSTKQYTHKTRDRTARTPLRTEVNSGVPDSVHDYARY